ncbi:MAG: DNA (cytosine-5-)-methyltransferase [Patescibacteria group bacterium]
MSGLLTIADTAKELGVSVDTIRRWEKKGLIKGSRSEQNYRVFNLDEVERIHNKVSGVTSSNNYKILKSKAKTKYTAIDLFAGAGGTALGLENAGFKHLMLNEIDKNAAATLRANKPKWNVVEDDIANIDFTQYKGKVDLIEGGFPCQAFSYAGNKRGFEDARGTLFYQFARAIKEAQPKVAVGENVKGLLTHEGGSTLRTMVDILQDLGYTVAYKVLRSQYLDVPQKRERLVIIAVRNDIDFPIVYPREKNYTVSIKEAIGDKPKSDGQVYSERKAKMMALVPPGGYWRDLPVDLQKEYMKASFYMGGGKTGMARRLSWDEPSLTLTCNPAQKQTERCHPEETRPLNVREYARIQTFPDDWQFTGSVSAQYKQIGNAVPVNLGFYMGQAVKAILDGKYDKEILEVVEPVQFDESFEQLSIIKA